MSSVIKLGTRGSALALAQANQTTALLQKAHPDLTVERVIIKTTGDRRTDVPLKDLSKVAQSESEKKVDGIWDKGVFIKELEVALAAGEIDLAVHSLKDLPTILESEFALPTVLEREDTRDVLITRGEIQLDQLNDSHCLATSSVRRERQLKHLFPGVQTCDLRGNVPTRLKKLAETTDYDGILLAAAGLNRLGFSIEGEVDLEGLSDSGLFAIPLPPEQFLPAAGQGAIALETRSDDHSIIELVDALNHKTTSVRITAEREFLRLLSAGCHTPVGVHSQLSEKELALSASVYAEDNLAAAPKTAQVSGSMEEPLTLAKELFESLQ